MTSLLLLKIITVLGNFLILSDTLLSKPSQTGRYFASYDGVYNFKTAHPTATKIAHNNVLIISNFWTLT